ncbi:diguanylate cyclase domain-containing protein [Zhongshania sp.]|uniref:diguanylate cyclase domain-containing protein n=1 Tax=Zhongshania sp. TaxID=1971902 RepID=UPI003566F119
MALSTWLTKHAIEPWLPTNQTLSNTKKTSYKFVVSVLLSNLAYTFVLIFSSHLLLALEPQGKKLILQFSVILGSGIFLALATIRIGGNRIAALNIYIATLSLGFMLVGLRTGGINSPVNACAIAIPALATLSIGALGGILWGIIIFSAYAAFAIAANNGYLFASIIAPHNVAVAEFAGFFTAASLTLFIIIYFDISSRKLRRLVDEEHTKYVQYAHQDSLTGLANRLYFNKQVESAITRSKIDNIGFCILYFDLNNFKVVNDNHGHHNGDYILQEFSKRLRRLTRGSDTIARLGGDEFCILSPSLNDPEVINKKINAYSNSLAEPLTLDDKSYQMSASIGHAIYPDHGTNYEELFRVADQNMYHSKRSFKSNKRVSTTSTE